MVFVTNQQNIRNNVKYSSLAILYLFQHSSDLKEPSSTSLKTYRIYIYIGLLQYGYCAIYITCYYRLTFLEIPSLRFVFTFTHKGTKQLVSVCMSALKEYLSCGLHQTDCMVSAVAADNSSLVC